MSGINASLQPATPDQWNPMVLAANSGRCFQGPIPVGDGFIIETSEAHNLLNRSDAAYADVVRPYIIGDDITDDPKQEPSRWIIDFGQRSLERAESYPEALSVVRAYVKPYREENNRDSYRINWWRFGESRPKMRKALSSLTRYIAGTATGKRLFLAWQDAWTCPSNLTNVFAFADDYSMGILQSRAHVSWAWYGGGTSTFETRLRYTPTTVFQTFPWPDPVDEEQQEVVAQASRELLSRRDQICRTENSGLTTVYNAMDEEAYTDLAELHQQLDIAVACCYGWPARIAQEDTELVARLRTLNQDIVENARTYEPFTVDTVQQLF